MTKGRPRSESSVMLLTTSFWQHSCLSSRARWLARSLRTRRTRARRLPPIAPVPIRQRPPIHANRLAVWGIVWSGKVHLLGVFLKTLDLVFRVEQKRLLLFILKHALLRGQPLLQLLQFELGNRSHLIRSALAGSESHKVAQHDHVHGAANFCLIARAGGRFPRRLKNLVEHFVEARIARIARMKLNQPRRAFLIQKKVRDVISKRLGRRQRVEVRKGANTKVFARARIAGRARWN